MDIENLKYVVGKAEANKPAIIRFFGSVNSSSVRDFNDEFLWLQNAVQPSKIVVLINSEGGSVLAGMSTFSVIASCPIETDCVIEGIAASMGSVIWAAGKNLYMHDYSLLMIHNPFNACGDENDENAKQATCAFRSQLETIYRQRFGMSTEQVKNIMDGKEGCDGTFFTAQAAVKAGFIPKDRVLKTSKHVRDKVKCQIDGVEDAASMRDVMDSISAELDENKLLEDVLAIRKQKDNSQFQDSKSVMENENLFLGTVSAQLGLAKDTQMEAVTARITALINSEASLKEIQAKLDALEIKFSGKEAELANVTSELETVKAALKEYKDAEEAARTAKIEATIQAAIEAGKIEASAKENWLKMAGVDFATVEATLNGIPAREDIAKKIAEDPANKDNIEASLKTAEEKMAEAIKAHLGDVKYEKF